MSTTSGYDDREWPGHVNKSYPTRLVRLPIPGDRAIVRQARTYAVLIDAVLLGAAAGMFITTCTQ